VRRISQRVVLCIHAALFDIANFFTDRQHRITEAIQFSLIFRLCGLDHQGARNWPTHGRRMEPAIHKALGNIIYRNACGLFKGPRINNALMCDTSRRAFVQNFVGALQARRDIVCVQDRDTCRLCQTIAPHHQAIRPTDRQKRRRAIWRCRNRPLCTTCFRMARQMRDQMRFDTDWPHAGAAAAMRNAERLVQVKMAHVTAQIPRTRQSHHGVHVGTINVHLATGVMHNLGHLVHRCLEHTVRRRIGDHTSCKIIRIFINFRTEIIEINIAVFCRFDRDHLPSDHLRRGRIGAMRRHRDQTDIAMPLPVRPMICRDGQQACIFPLGAAVGLHGNGIISGDITQLVRQIIDQMCITFGLIFGNKRVDQRELSPADWHHLRRRIQLHGA